MKIKNALKLFSVLLPVAGLFYVYLYLTPLYHDDYSYFYSYYDRTRITSVSDIFLSMYGHYFVMNGRIVTHFIGQLFLLMGKPIFNVINTLGFLFLGVLVYLNAYKTIKNVRMLPLVFVYFSLFLFAPAFGESFLWLIGSANYMWGIIIVLLFFLPYRLCATHIDCMPVAKEIFASIGMFLLGFIAGGTNENNSVALIVMVAMVLLYRLLKYRKLSAWMICGWVGVIAGCAFMMFAPAQLNRLDNAGGIGNIFSYAFVKEFLVSSLALVREFGMLFVLIAIMLAVYVTKKIEAKKQGVKGKKRVLLPLRELYIEHFTLLLYFCGFLVSFYSMTVLIFFPERTWSGPLAFLIVFALVLYKSVCEHSGVFKRFLPKAVVGVVLSAVTFSVYFQHFFLLRDVYRDYAERTVIVEKQMSDGNTVLTIPSIYSSSKYSCYDEYGDLDNSPDYWTNTQLARYYGVDKVVKAD